MTDTSMSSSSLAEEEPHASSLMAVRFPECKACRVQYEFPTLNGPQVQTDKAAIIVAQLEKEGKLGDLQNLRFRVSEISVNTQNGIISVKHKGRLSLQKGQEWIQFMREQLDPVIGTVNVEIETAPHSEAIQADVKRTFSNADASCFLSLDRKSLLIVSSKEQDVKQVEAFVRAWSGTVAVCQDVVGSGDCRVSSNTVSRVASPTRQDINYELVDMGSKGNLASSKPDQASLQVPQTSGACGEVSQTPVFSHSDSAFFRSFYNTLSLQSMEFKTFSCKLFKITDQLTVQFYKKDIVKSKTDAVVSPTNSRLETSGEVAKALSQAAGPEMDQELCKELIQHEKKIRTTQVVKTGAYGQLGHLKYVLHAVGPHISNETTEFELAETFLNCLLLADSLTLKSITFPFISTGGYCVTLDQCVTRFLTSVLVYSRNKYSSLEEIHIVHYDINVVSEAILIAEQFLKTETCMTATQWIVHERQQYNRHITRTDGAKNVKAKHSKSRPKDKMPAFPKKEYVNTTASLQKANSQMQSQSVMESSIITAKMSGDSADTSALHLTTSLEDTDRACPICTLPVQNPKTLTCGCVFCTVCINDALNKASVCPQCQLDFNIQLGNQPRLGQMFQRISNVTHVAGFPTPGAIIINFKFPDGVQEAYHPEPGKPYKGIYRTAYLPLSQEGQEVLVLLEKAFRHFLMFTITDVPTAGQTSPIVWNDIHLITNIKGENFPDQALDYLQRVKEELATKGIVA